ncbi:MAG: 5-(carboxyamino)imidazole ribonucleotide synthase [Gammaproteobacteria bacterium]|jgi:5-(carboxyamino)imidazole ribonucleotide synthase
MTNTPLKPGSTIGILGGGQLGWMLGREAERLGFKLVVLDSSEDCASARITDQLLVGQFADKQLMAKFDAAVDVITLETEHVNFEFLDALPNCDKVWPSASVFKIVQDRRRQREFLDQNGFPHTQWQSISSLEDCANASYTTGTKAILKSRSGGYDGKGQVRVDRFDSLADAWNALGGIPAVLEAFVPFAMEVSVILTRGRDGECAEFPVAENVHLNHVLHLTVAPARISQETQQRALDLCAEIAQAMDYVGTMAVELFVLNDGSLLVNEIAPRVHNSGHFTLGACETSQFEQHIRAVAGLPLGSSKAMTPSVMLNLLGDLWERGEPDWSLVHKIPGASLYLYGKFPARPGRKMGHILLRSDHVDAAVDQADKLFEALSS